MTHAAGRVLPWLVIGLVSCHPPPEPTPVPRLDPLPRPVVSVTPGAGDDLLSVPQDVMVRRGGVDGVFVLLEDRARFQMVRTGHRRRGQVEILSGLHGGEQLVGGDLGEVRDGTPITLGR